MMETHNSDSTQGQGCGCGCNRREFLASAALATGLTACATMGSTGAPVGTTATIQKGGATVRVAFLYPPSRTFADDPDGWWSWPGNECDAEGRQVTYTTALRRMEQNMGMNLIRDETPTLRGASACSHNSTRCASPRPDLKGSGLCKISLLQNIGLK